MKLRKWSFLVMLGGSLLISGGPALAGWDGFYYGVNGGGAASKVDTERTLTAPNCLGNICARQQAGVASLSPSLDATSANLGLHLGYNWVSGRLMYGVEADATYLGFKSDSTGSLTLAGTGGGGAVKTFTVTDHAEATTVMTLRPRIGFAASDSFLVFASAGLALTRAKFSNETTVTVNGLPAASYSTSSTSSTGTVFGAGVDYAWSKTASVRLEYLHYGFKSAEASSANTVTAFTDLDGSSLRTKSELKIDQLRVGYTWRY